MIISLACDMYGKSAISVPTANDMAESDMEMEDNRRTSVLETQESLLATLESSFEFLSSIVQFIPVDVLYTAFGIQDLQQKLSLLLCRCTSSCSGSIAISSVTLVGLLAQRDGQYREQHVSGEANDCRLIQPRINALLTNSLLRVIEAHSLNMVSATGEYQPLCVVDAAISAIVDLHTSDDPELLQNLQRLQTLKKLADSVSHFQTALDAVGDQPNRMIGDNEEGDDCHFSDCMEMLSDFKDTISNVKSFIEYKTLFSKGH